MPAAMYIDYGEKVYKINRNNTDSVPDRIREPHRWYRDRLTGRIAGRVVDSGIHSYFGGINSADDHDRSLRRATEQSEKGPHDVYYRICRTVGVDISSSMYCRLVCPN